MRAACRRTDLRDLKNTPLNSALPSSPTRRSSDLSPRFCRMTATTMSGLSSPLACVYPINHACGLPTHGSSRSQEHTSQLRSPLFPYTPLFRSFAPVLRDDGDDDVRLIIAVGLRVSDKPCVRPADERIFEIGRASCRERE